MERKLPDELISDISAKKVIVSILLTIFIVGIINFMAYEYLKEHTPNLGYEINFKKWKILSELDGKKDWLILGDSTCNQGIDPSIIKKDLDVDAVNLCTIGSMLTVGDSWMLELYIKKNGPPKDVLIVHAYDVLDRMDISLSSVSQLPLDVLFHNEPQPWSFSIGDRMQLYFYKYFPLYSQSASLTELISGTFYAYSNNPRNSHIFSDSGFMIENLSDSASVRKDTEDHIKFVSNRKFEPSVENLKGLENIKYLSEKYNFNVYLAVGPIHDKLYANQEFKRYYGELRDFQKNFCEGSRNMHFISDEPATFSENEMSSSDHVVGDAATIYTRDMISKIK